MVKVKNIEDLLAEQAVRKVATCYSRGVDRTDLDLLNSAFHEDAEVRYGSYDGHYADLASDYSAMVDVLLDSASLSICLNPSFDLLRYLYCSAASHFS